jgi:uncharacterized protein (DUF58 family)
MPVWDESGVAAHAARLRLAVDARRRRGLGARLGQGPGASLEFHDHRAYAPGDDLRHLDWAVAARTDQLMLRRQRQEVSPRLELLVDGSASMGLSHAKAALAAGLAALLAQLAEADGARPRVWWCGVQAQASESAWRTLLRQGGCGGASGCEQLTGLIPGSERILISDGLCPVGGSAVVRRLGAGAGRLHLVQVLQQVELDPQAHGAVRLEDVEGGVSEQVVDAALRLAYRERLARHQEEWRAALAGRGVGVVAIRVEAGLEAAIRSLVASGLVEVGR